jgi:hypothetical protein
MAERTWVILFSLAVYHGIGYIYLAKHPCIATDFYFFNHYTYLAINLKYSKNV